MIEFFLSKFWAIICALVLLGAVTTSIDGLGNASEQRSQDAEFRSFVEEIDSFLRLEGASMVVIPASDVIQNDEDHIEFGNGSVWLFCSSGTKVSSLEDGIVVLDDEGRPIAEGTVSVHMSGSVVLTKDAEPGVCVLQVHGANVSTIFFTESMNISQSLSSL